MRGGQYSDQQTAPEQAQDHCAWADSRMGFALLRLITLIFETWNALFLLVALVMLHFFGYNFCFSDIAGSSAVMLHITTRANTADAHLSDQTQPPP